MLLIRLRSILHHAMSLHHLQAGHYNARFSSYRFLTKHAYIDDTKRRLVAGFAILCQLQILHRHLLLLLLGLYEPRGSIQTKVVELRKMYPARYCESWNIASLSEWAYSSFSGRFCLASWMLSRAYCIIFLSLSSVKQVSSLLISEAKMSSATLTVNALMMIIRLPLITILTLITGDNTFCHINAIINELLFCCYVHKLACRNGQLTTGAVAIKTTFYNFFQIRISSSSDKLVIWPSGL